jgi:prepilin-type N-terminal cleavage/methylation domain-containing protein
MLNRNRRNADSKAGFTLIELLSVLVIIGILSAIAIPRFMNARHKGFLSAMQSDLENFALAQESYHSDNHIYANTVALLDNTWTQGVHISINESDNTGWAVTGTHPGVPGENCAIYFGTGSAANATPAVSAGAVYCTIN